MAGSVLVTPTTLPDNRTTPVILMASNASGYQEDHDLATTTAGLTEKQRIVLACVTALLLAVCAIVIGFVLRRLMRKSSSSGVYTVEANFPLWRKRSDANSDDVCALNQQRAASISNAANPTNLKDTQPNQLAWTSTGMTTSDGLVTSSADAIVTSSGDVIVTSTSSGGMTSSQSGHTVITMTMRNNHLIVETEEPIDTPPLSTMPDDQPVEVHQEPAPLAVTSLADVRTRHPYVGTGLSQADSEESDGNSPRHPYMYGGGQSGKNTASVKVAAQHQQHAATAQQPATSCLSTSGSNKCHRMSPTTSSVLHRRHRRRQSLATPPKRRLRQSRLTTPPKWRLRQSVTTVPKWRLRQSVTTVPKWRLRQSHLVTAPKWRLRQSVTTTAKRRLQQSQNRTLHRQHSSTNQLQHVVVASSEADDQEWQHMRQLARSRSGIIVLDQMSSTSV
ncbi:uncharacterized protein LOC111059741 isoform X1 [Nilaparvata lugens]|uniref:uncharacterized protein LOC111059741 isoform X1 n=1 Tax=Nilaparvata lugens TaxID=108931 RepID=UPI000B984234|nr:uncharacterized protein LOC111059741 isoform X1 [Nilaparvata lugens]